MRKNIAVKTYKYYIKCFLYLKDHTAPFGLDPSSYLHEEFEFPYLFLNYSKALTEALNSKFIGVKDIYTSSQVSLATENSRVFEVELKREKDNRKIKGFVDITYLGLDNEKKTS